MRGYVTNNNGFWIRWLDFLALLYNSNQLRQLTINDCLRLTPFRSGLRMSSLLLWRRTKNHCSQSESYVTTDGQSVSLSWNKAFLWRLRPDFYYCQTAASLLMQGASLTRGRVCRLQLLLALAIAVILWCKVIVALRLTVSLGVEPHLGVMTRYLLFFDSYGLVFVGRPLWREDGSAFYICFQATLIQITTSNSLCYCFPRCHGNVLTETLRRKWIIPCLFVASGTCLPNRWLAVYFRSGSANPAFRRHVTIQHAVLVL
jgi:hypothetical protein